MALDEVRLLVVRPADMVVAAVRFIGFAVGADAVTAAAGAQVEVTLPPQATGEGPWAAGVQSTARVGGPSRLTFAVDSEVEVPLTADGVLSALSTATVVHGDAPAGSEPLAVELPWHLTFAPRPVADGDALLCDVPATALAGPGGARGLWHLRLEAASTLALLPIDVAPDTEVTPALGATDRGNVFAQGTPPQAPPTAPFMDLSPLGGTMTARGSWEDFSWEHHVVLGRDMAVRTTSRGVIYPFGHRAVLVKTSNRQLLPPGSGPADAGLLEQSWLVVPDPVRGRSADEATARVLPFDEVEVLERVMPLGVPAERVAITELRVPKRLDELRAGLDTMKADKANAESSLPALVEQARADIVALGESDKADFLGQLAGLQQQIGDLQARKQASDDWDANHPPFNEIVEVQVIGPDGESHTEEQMVLNPGEPNPDPWGQQDQNFLEGLLAQAAPLEKAVAQIDTNTRNALDSLATEDGQLAFGGDLGGTIATIRALRDAIPAREALVDAIVAEAAVPLTIASWPQAPGGTTLQVPIRCDEVRMSMPVMFLYDQDLPDTEEWPAFQPLSDPGMRSRIDAEWRNEEGRHVPIPGIPVDLVRADTRGQAPAPNDVLPVQRLSFGAAHDGVGFRAVLEGAKVVLAAAQELVPGVTEAVDVAYREAYRLRGEAEHAVLDLVGTLPVDFSAAADKAGGLVAPNFAADVISRLHGPTPAAALVGLLDHPPDLSTVFGATKLLGISLGDLLAPLAEAVPEPLTIKADPAGGATMTWTGLTLKDAGPLRTTPGRTKLELTVERTPRRTTTTCSLDEFALVLPPTSVELVRLDLARLTFTQELGRPPQLQMKGLKVTIGGDLGLLEALQDAVDLGDVAPRVHTSTSGMNVDYTLAVPEVTAGMFLLTNIAVRAAVDVPFDGRPIVTTLAFASRDKPFHLGVSVFGGGGYLLFEIDGHGIRTLEASLDFGAAVAINVGVAKAEVHALGGVRFKLEPSGQVRVSGFLRIGGSVDVLGLVSVTVELRVELTYEAPNLTGRATAVIEIDVTFWSGSIELDSGEYTFVGGRQPQAVPPSSSISVPPPTLPDWQKYRDAFEPA